MNGQKVIQKGFWKGLPYQGVRALRDYLFDVPYSRNQPGEKTIKEIESEPFSGAEQRKIKDALVNGELRKIRGIGNGFEAKLFEWLGLPIPNRLKPTIICPTCGHPHRVK